MPYFQQRAEMDPLDRVYVRLELRPGVRSALPVGAGRKGESGRPGGSADRLFDRPLGIREVLALAPEEHPWVTRRRVVLGDPGAGKTTLVRHLAAALARDPGPDREGASGLRPASAGTGLPAGPETERPRAPVCSEIGERSGLL